MASVDSPFGFRPVLSHGSTWTGGSVRCVVPATDGTAMFTGDMVALAGGDDTDNVGGDPDMFTVKQLSTGGANGIVFGCIVGWEPDYSNLNTKHRLASTKRVCSVVLALPGVIFEAQMDAAWVAGDSGTTADYVVGTGDTTTGRSGAEIGTNSTGAAQFLLIGPSQTVGEDVDTASAGTNVLVHALESQWSTGAVGI